MLNIQGLLTCQSKLPMNYKHLSQAEKYQIHALMKAGHNQSEIAKVLDLNKSSVSRELARNSVTKGCPPIQEASELAAMRCERSRNACKVTLRGGLQACQLLQLQRITSKIVARLHICHEELYQHVPADKAHGGVIWKSLLCQRQKRSRYAGGRDRRGQIPNGRPLSEMHLHIEFIRQVGHRECDTVIDANHKGAVVTMAERKSG